ncbi:type II toxin-antitoxin system RelE/ParE family toxin [Amorphus sp. 3PC139-8]|uniref:type II toxin-antitoxin system RelE/ParE family toxin n=1 Tax=Amorphus sp. 3PC139-8 TaxID=2735676 RepID=UPI00345CDB7A
MATYRLTATADAEIDAITEYSVLNFGLETARDYITGLHDRFGLLADHPSWGNDYSHISPGLRRYEYRSHLIYYRPQGGRYPHPPRPRRQAGPGKALLKTIILLQKIRITTLQSNLPLINAASRTLRFEMPQRPIKRI